jgi:hypothetical protein
VPCHACGFLSPGHKIGNKNIANEEENKEEV